MQCDFRPVFLVPSEGIQTSTGKQQE